MRKKICHRCSLEIKPKEKYCTLTSYSQGRESGRIIGMLVAG